MSENGKKQDLDDYWDIEKLVPRRRSRLSPFATTSPTATHTVPESKQEPQARTEEERKISFDDMRGTKEEERVTYVPSGDGLIKEVTVTKFIDKYDFYDSFRKAALLYFDCPSTKCEFVQFFSYMPQYSHLTQAQRAYYLYWRSEVRQGRYIKSDYSYIYLYIYEILNLPDKIPPESGIKLLCDIWRAYRKQLPRLDTNLAVWVQDYCLVHALPCPIEYISDFMFDCINASVLREFYISDLTSVGIAGVEPLLASLSSYDWRRGKFVGADSGKSSIVKGHEDYKKHMLGAMFALLSRIWSTDIVNSNTKLFTLKRSSFPNSLCTHMVKSRLEIRYIYLIENEALCAAVTAAVRYVENKLRALLGVKSRLGVNGLPDTYRAVIDNYFDTCFKAEERRRREENRPEYERLYEAPCEELSFSGADEIERDSWEITARLVEAEEDISSPATDDASDRADDRYVVKAPTRGYDVIDTLPRDSASISPIGEIGIMDNASNSATATSGIGVIDAPSSIDTPSELDCYGLSKDELTYLFAVSREEESQFDAFTAGSMAEHINEAFAENFGDVILELAGDQYKLIEDYEEDIIEWLSARMV